MARTMIWPGDWWPLMVDINHREPITLVTINQQTMVGYATSHHWLVAQLIDLAPIVADWPSTSMVHHKHHKAYHEKTASQLFSRITITNNLPHHHNFHNFKQKNQPLIAQKIPFMGATHHFGVTHHWRRWTPTLGHSASNPGASVSTAGFAGCFGRLDSEMGIVRIIRRVSQDRIIPIPT